MTQYFASRIKTISRKDCLSNLCGNWFIPFSAIFFLLTNIGLPAFKNLPVNSYYSFAPALLLITLAAAVCPPFSSVFARTSVKLKIISLADAVGICYCTWNVLKEKPYIFGGDTLLLRVIFMVLAIPFAFAVCLIFWERLVKILKDVISKTGADRTELFVYALLAVVFFAFATFCFLSSSAFYGEDYNVDIIYTSDSHKLLVNNAFIVFDHIENDFRQPLFGLFSAPFAGIPCLIGSVIPVIPMALFLDYAQILLILTGMFIISSDLELNKIQRIFFMLIGSSAFTALVFSVMLEQYATAFFWLVLTLHLMVNKKKEAVAASYAASGALLVSGALVPFILKPEKLGKSSILLWLKDMVLYGVDFCLLIIMAGRFHLIWNGFEILTHLMKFTGKSVGFKDRILQYINFAGGCFLAPESLAVQMEGGYNGWQLAEVTSVNWFGIVILALALAGFFVTRKSIMSKAAFGWMLLSVAVLVIAGWGISENGLFLYSLYFGWPFLILIFNLIKAVGDKLKIKLFVPIASAALCVFMLVYNIPALIKIIEFAVREFPV